MAEFSSVMVLPSWGSHPDDPVEALQPGYWGAPALAGDANFIIHRQSGGQVEVTETKNKLQDQALVVVLGFGRRVLDAAEREAFDGLIARLRSEKRITGKIKQVWNGGLSREEDPMPVVAGPDTDEQDVPEEVPAEPEPDDDDDETQDRVSKP